MSDIVGLVRMIHQQLIDDHGQIAILHIRHLLQMLHEMKRLGYKVRRDHYETQKLKSFIGVRADGHWIKVMVRTDNIDPDGTLLINPRQFLPVDRYRVQFERPVVDDTSVWMRPHFRWKFDE